MSQKELADKLGYTSAQYISNWETGKASPPIKKIGKILDILGLPRQQALNFFNSELQKQLKTIFEAF